MPISASSPGEYWDEDSQLQYNRARWYDPATARFLSIDPFEGIPSNPASLHRYAYAHADPVQGSDPGGQETLLSLSIGSDVSSSVRG
jgi:RHS repeat-associated protein